MGSPRRSKGDEVVWRSRPTGKVGFVCATRVLFDDPVAIALYQPTGSTVMRRCGDRGGPGGRLLLEWNGKHRRETWQREPTLRLHPAGQHYSVIRTWDAARSSYRGWYVNLEQDWRRTPIGFDSRDDILDLILADDLGDAELKDDDELTAAVTVGRLHSEDAEEIRARAERVVKRAFERGWPFVEGYWSELTPAGLDEPVDVCEGWDHLFSGPL